MNKKLGHFWSIILRFCRLEDRIQCGYINKFINEKYNSIAPSYSDLKYELSDNDELIFHPNPIELVIPLINMTDFVKKSYLNRFVYLNWNAFVLGANLAAKHNFISVLHNGRSFPNSELNDPWSENLRYIIDNLEKDWIIILRTEKYDGCGITYALNINSENKFYNKICRYHGSDLTKPEKERYLSTMDGAAALCHIRSFLNHFPILFRDKSWNLFMEFS